MSNLKTVLEKFNSRLNYREQDRKALDISRSLAAGNLGDDKNYAEWASITDDPLVLANYVKTYVTTHVSKLTSAPFRPVDDGLFELGKDIRLNNSLAEQYQDVLSDGYSFMAIGMKDSKPVLKQVDARYIMFNGDDPTLKDSTDIVVFEIVPIPMDADRDRYALGHPCDYLQTYVDFDSDSERVRVTHYHKGKDGVVMSLYDEDYENPVVLPLKSLDRIPVVRFFGERVELSDKRYHYRGLYYMMASVLKALAVAGTKINSRAASSDDANYIVRADAISNHDTTWKNSGAKEIDNVDGNGNPIPDVQFVPHDNEFLMNAFNNWKNVISDMLGPVVASGSEAVTRDEVQARNEVRDAIANIFLSRLADTIEEVYRIIQMYITGDTATVKIVGGYIDSVKRQKDISSVVTIYNYAKEGGLNTQGLVKQLVALMDLPADVKTAILVSFEQDPFKSPQVIQLQQTVQQLNNTIQQQNQQIALLRLQATQRLERQKEFIDSTERTKRLELAYKQWSDEQKQSQEARMAVLQDCLAKMDYEGALRILQEINDTANPIIADNIINLAANAFSEENSKSVQSALDETTQPVPQPSIPQAGPSPYQTVVPRQQTVKQTANVTAPMPRPAVTTFNDA